MPYLCTTYFENFDDNSILATSKQTYRIDNRKVYWLVGVIAVLLLIFFAASRRTKATVSSMQVFITHLPDGTDLIKEQDVKIIIKKSFDFDVNEAAIGAIDVARVEQVLELDPFVQNAEVFITANNTLSIKIQQREPILRILDDNGMNYYLDKNGIKMPPSKYSSARVPIATGAIAPYVVNFRTKKQYLLKDVFDLVLRLNQDEWLAANVQQIHVNAVGEFTLIPLIGDQKIMLGNLQDLEDKLSRLKVFYDQAMPYEGWRKYATINLKYKGQIVCKKK